jgi:hypothetical protein
MRFDTASPAATTRGPPNAKCGTAYGSHRHDCHPMSGDRVPAAAPERRFPSAGGTVHRIWAVLAACPEDPPSVLGGGVLVRWSERGTFVVVTMPGSGEVNQRLGHGVGRPRAPGRTQALTGRQQIWRFRCSALYAN